jgi:peptidoglycan/xylan/chitin deacetylase (PgdA/CDA1 family)
MGSRISINNIDIDCVKLLQGRYEAERLPEDFSSNSAVPDFAFNVLNPLGLLYRPVVDKARLRNHRKECVWPDGKPFAVCLTHDVDNVSKFSMRQSIRAGRFHLANRTSVSGKVGGVLGIGLAIAKVGVHLGSKDPLHCYERWLEVEEEVGARSTFFFWPGLSAVGKRHHSDCKYELSDRVIFDRQKCNVAEMIREIDHRGWEIALHPSWYSFNNLHDLERQKEALEKCLGKEVVSIRQHYLNYDIRVTPSIQSRAGLKYDATLGFNDNIGFRFGTCHPWYVFDLSAQKELPIMEIPLIIQDGGLLARKGMRLDEDTAFAYVKQLTEEVEIVGGVLTLNWHADSLVRTTWWNLYIRILKYLNEKNPWFGTVKQIGEWYKNNHLNSLNKEK